MKSKFVWPLAAALAVAAGMGARFVKTRNERIWAEQEATLAKGRDYEEKRAARLAAEEEAAKPPSAEQLIAEKKLQVGFTPEQVERAWGKPKSRSETGGVGATQVFFHYEATTLFFVNGRLVRWTKRQ